MVFFIYHNHHLVLRDIVDLVVRETMTVLPNSPRVLIKLKKMDTYQALAT
jgi:hypothetical protein